MATGLGEMESGGEELKRGSGMWPGMPQDTLNCT